MYSFNLTNMNNVPNPIFLLSSLFLFNQANIETCLDTVCQMNEPIIRFPFHIEGRPQAMTCGYKGFKVLCSEEGQTLLNLPYWGELKIQTINYAAQELYVNDPNNCLPKRLLSLNLSGSPYDAVYYQEFTFFNCSFNLEYLIARYKPIPCLSDYSNYGVFATPSKTASSVHLSSVCELVETVRVPVQSPFYDHVLSSELNEDLRLSWDSPPCGKCESRGGRCGFKFNGNSSTLELACYDDPSRQGTTILNYSTITQSFITKLWNYFFFTRKLWNYYIYDLNAYYSSR